MSPENRQLIILADLRSTHYHSLEIGNNLAFEYILQDYSLQALLFIPGSGPSLGITR
jgi:hypothetical protein